jgi:uncharacterized membrane protein YoaK (UPF0700 family)
MSGASISIGVGLSESRWTAVGQAGLLICAFVGAATAANLLSGLLEGWKLPATLALESALLFLAVVMTLRGSAATASIIPVVAAMGAQNGILRPLNGVRLGVTFMTGTLVSVGETLAGLLLRRTSWRLCCAHALLWCAFVAGAAAGAGLHAAAGFVVLAGPATVVAVMALAAAVRTLRDRRRPARRKV